LLEVNIHSDSQKQKNFFFFSVRFGPIPVAFVALVVGTILGWATSLNHAVDVRNATLVVKPYALAFPLKEMFIHLNEITPYLSTTIPTAISIAIGTIQCVESAKRAGDFYPTREAMFADGVGTLIASSFGSILGMTSKRYYYSQGIVIIFLSKYHIKINF
jgi:xanthine/uracil permease